MSDLPEPLAPPECDLRDFGFTPIFRARLFGSSFHARATDSEWRGGVTLWLKSWDQVPAGSLPDDDIDLCRLAELGRDLKTWRKIKDGALHGWFKCSDGRLYHNVVAEGVAEAWAKRRSATTKGKAGASKRWGVGYSTGNAPAIGTATENNATAIARAMPGDSNRQGQGQGQGIPLAKANGQQAAGTLFPEPAKPPETKPVKVDPWKEVYDRGKAVLGREAGGIITNLRALYDQKPRKVLAKIEDAAEQRDPLEWISAFLWKVDDGGKLAGHDIGGVPP